MKSVFISYMCANLFFRTSANLRVVFGTWWEEEYVVAMKLESAS